MKYSLLILQKENPTLNGTDLGYYRTNWSWELEPLIIFCCYNWWTRVLERGTTSKANTSDVGNLTMGTWQSVGPSGAEVKLELKKWPVLLRIGLLKYTEGGSFHPILRFCFSRIRPPLIFSNFNKFHFLLV